MFDLFKRASVSALLLLTAGAAFAGEKPVIVRGDTNELRSERITYAELDLTRSRDLKMLNFRVAGAVERVCQRDFGRDGLQDRGYYSCEGRAWEHARPQIDQAVARSQQLAMNGRSPVAAVSITVSAS